MSLEIKNIRKIELPHSHLPSLVLILMTDGMYHFDCRWGDRDWSIVLNRYQNLGGRYPITVRSAQGLFSTTECGTGMLSENFLRYSVMKMMNELNKTPI